ncbi:Response regulator PleD [Pseudobythopirellula maris]|uniref:diguanylate cyclase n=1 Tax=Pseudobythopirellula maris TaxID=2527991 RepID=A0A5C5ZSM6_9BACT|nr:GGDEF domain-containing protein [Pseudobythopirellula maris]TWT90068.1 Response regulator PleD [Pseudobythopirellula maris]
MTDKTATMSFRESWPEWLLSRPKTVVAVSLLVASVVAMADYATGDPIPLLVCYLPSVMLIAWVTRISYGFMLAAVCCCGWLLDDLLMIDEQPFSEGEVWTASIHGVFFTVVLTMLMRLRIAQANERRLARTDGLTGLHNPKAFRELAELEIARSARTGRPVSVAFLDCDNFKMVNDTLGHLEGDRLLAAIAERMQQVVRKIDMPARMGGDEFAILLPETSEQEARVLIERLRTELNERMQQDGWPVTFSIGVAVYASAPESVDALIQGADVLMYEVKTGAKDAVAFRLVA